MTERVILELSDENARILEREYDALVERKADALRGQGWERQGDVVEAELSECNLGTKVSRLLEYHVDGVES
jgi:hypothetical protein